MYAYRMMIKVLVSFEISSHFTSVPIGEAVEVMQT